MGQCVCLRVCLKARAFCVWHLFGQQDGGVAVLLAGLGAQRDEPEQEQRQAGAPDHQLPVVVTVQERFVDVEQLEERDAGTFKTGALPFLIWFRLTCLTVFLRRHLGAADEDDGQSEEEGGRHDDTILMIFNSPSLLSLAPPIVSLQAVWFSSFWD